MPQYMLVLGGVPRENRNPEGSEKYAAVMRGYNAWTEKLARGGHLKDAHKLKDGMGRRLTNQGGAAVDGPFTETKETIGGYYLIEARDEAEAVSLAMECPTVVLQGGYCEVREVEM